MRNGTFTILIVSLALVTSYAVLGYQVLRTSPVNDITICALGDQGLYLPSAACRAYLPIAARSSEADETQNAFHLAVNAFEPGRADTLDTLEVISILLASGADIDNPSPITGYSALHAAVLFNSPSLAEFLLNEGASIEVSDRTNQLTPLQMANELQSTRPSVDRSSLIELLSRDNDGQSS